MSTASLFRQQSTGVLLLHTVYLTIWYISKKWVFYQFVQRFHLLFLIFIVFCLITWFTIGEKGNPQIQVFVWGERGLTFYFPWDESQMCPSTAHSFCVNLRWWGNIKDVAYKQPAIIPPQLRGLVFFSNSLYTLQHLHNNKVWQIQSNLFYTRETDFSKYQATEMAVLVFWNQF